MTAIAAERLALKECGRPARRQIDAERVLRLREDWWTQQMIADIMHCSVATVRRVLRENGDYGRKGEL